MLSAGTHDGPVRQEAASPGAWSGTPSTTRTRLTGDVIMLPGLAQHIDFQPAHNDYTRGFLVVSRADRTTAFGYVWKHALSDGTSTWVAQPDTANDASRIPGFQSREWAGEFLYEREWPKFVRREDAAPDALPHRPQPGCTEHAPCGTCSLCEPDLSRRGVL
ncbi:hypothetical protein ACFV2Q_36725 [Streptomyces sp. NPDC059650]|uniref:hypothetical protein n=1 Tax=Streptomyces sp. NPDC059650 TaxID=3346896 RepID=UPI003683A92C